MPEKFEGTTLSRLAQAIGHRVWEIRREKGLTQMKLAEMVKSSVNYIGCLERGQETNLKLQTLLNLANALEVPVKDFFADPERPRSPRSRGRPKGS